MPGPYGGCNSERRRKNLKILFDHTSILPFKWRGKYLCFYCGKNYTEYTELKKHTKSHGLCNTKDYALKLIKGNNIEIKIDVSEIVCDICNENFNRFEEIIDHLIDKHNLGYNKSIDIPFQEYRLVDCSCLYCEEKFAYFGYLVTHVNNMHPQNCLICNDCGGRFNKKRDLAIHIRNYHREGGYPCDSCLLSFETLQSLRRHKNNTHFRQCKSCNLKFASLSLLQKHLQTSHVHDEGNMKCNYCLKEFHSSIGLRQHISKCKIKISTHIKLDSFPEDTLEPRKKQNIQQIRQNIQCVLNMSTAIPFKFFSKYSCFYCSKKFFEFDELRQHTNIEHPICDLKQKCMQKCKGERITVKIDIANLACKLCTIPIDNLDKLIDHLIEKHEANYDKNIKGCLEPFRIIKDNMPCPICPDKVFRYFGILLRHVNAEHNNNNRICDFCGRSFRNAANLNVHITYSHTGSCECNVCGVKYKNQWCLARHRATTHNAKEHKCSKCSETFTSQYHKQKHLIDIHNIGHKCGYCDKMFTRNSFMKDHIRRTHLKERNVPCSICNEKFFDNYLLRMHMVKHEGFRKFSCTVCGKAFLRRSNLASHMEMHKKYGHISIESMSSKFDTVEDKYKKMEIARKLLIKRRNVEYVLQYSNVTPFIWHKGKYKCFYCNETTKDPVLLREHSASIHQFANLELVVFDRTKNNRNKDAAVKIDVTDISCKLCPQVVTNLEELIHHLIIAHDAEYDVSVPNCLLPFKLDKEQPTCPTCNMKFVFFEYLLRHANKHHLCHHYICDVCGTSFQGENHLKMHYRYYHREGGYSCEYCDVTFSTLSKKILHEKNVHLVNLSTCPHCPETFKSPYLKKLHLANIHGVEELKIKCPYCPKVYPQESIMSRHMRRVHLREKNVECEVCGDKFFGPYDVKLHMMKHNGDKKFICSVCGKKFSKRSNLNAHTVLHIKDRNFICEYCNKSFGHQANLKMHIRNRHCPVDDTRVVDDVDESELIQMEVIHEELDGEAAEQYLV